MFRQLRLAGCVVAVIVVALQADALAAPAGSVCNNLKPPPVDKTHSRSWCHVDATKGKVRVWWQKGSAPGEQVATVALAAVDGGAWQRLVSHFGKKEPLRDDLDDRTRKPRPRGDFGGSGALDVTVVDSLSSDPHVYEQGRWEPTRDACYSPRNGHVLLAPPALAGAAFERRIKLAVAHELAHAIIAAFPVDHGNDCSGHYPWLNEATATWASGYAYEPALLDDEWSYLLLDEPSTRLNFPAPDLPIYKGKRDARWYAGSLLFLFFERIYGSSLAWEAWVHANTAGSGIDAVGRALLGAGRRGLPAVWPRFAQWLWNQPPVDQLSASGIPRGAITVGTKPTGSTAKKPTNKKVKLTLPGAQVAHAERLKVKLAPLSVQYRKLTNPNPRIRTITYRPPTLKPNRPSFATSALTSAPGSPPRLEELEEPHMFCLTDHPVRDLVLMFSLGDLAGGGPSTGEAQVWTSNSCAVPQQMAWESPEAGGSLVGGRKDLRLSVELDRPAEVPGVELRPGALTGLGTGVPSGAVTVPASVVVPAGKQKVTFNVGTAPVDSTLYAVIQASRQKELAIPGTVRAGLKLVPPGPARVVLPARIKEEQEFSGTVFLNGAAGPNGMKVTLHPWGPAPIEKLPDSVTVPAGSKQATFKGKAGKLNCPSSCEGRSSVRAIAHGQDSIGWTVIFK
jgi:hypothetical protein